MMMIWFTYL